AEQRGCAGRQVNRIEGRDGVVRAGERGEGRRIACNVEADELARVDAERADRVERAVVRRVLDNEPVETVINIVERRRGRAGEVVGVGRAGDVRRLALVWIAGSKTERAVGAYHRARVRVEAQVLTRVADEPDTINRRVEINAELCAAKGRRERCAADLRGRARLRVDRIEAARAAHAVELPVGGADVYAAQNFSGLQTRYGDVIDDHVRHGTVEGQQTVADRERIDVRGRREIGCALRGCIKLPAYLAAGEVGPVYVHVKETRLQLLHLHRRQRDLEVAERAE